MNNWQFTIVILLTLSCSFTTEALSPKYEADRLLLLAEDQIKNRQYSAANASLNQIKSLTTAYPDNFYYLSALTLEHDKKFSAAARMMETYVETAGETGEHYYAALEKITRLRATPQPTKQPNKHSTQNNISWSEPEIQADYLSNIQFLYQVSNPQKALLAHINNLLNFYGYGDKDIKASNRVLYTNRFSLSVKGAGELVTTKREIHPSSERSTSSRMPVYGVNPYVTFECRSRDSSCVINHPIDNSPWLQIVNNDEAAQELSKAVAELIKLIQTRS